MAYVIIEDRLFVDVRFRKLARETGEAAGLLALVQAWSTARDYYVKAVRAERQYLGVPKPLFLNTLHSQEILNCGLARVSDCGDFVLLSGTERLCAKLSAKIRNGRVGGQKKSENHKPRNDGEISLAKLELTGSERVAKPKRSGSSPYPYPDPKNKNLNLPPNAPDGPFDDQEFLEILTAANRGLLARVKPQAMRQWMLTYPSWFIKQESERAAAWVATNPAKGPKSNFGKFMNGWLDRGYKTYRQTNDVGPQTKKTLVMTLDPIDVSYPGKTDSGESV